MRSMAIFIYLIIIFELMKMNLFRKIRDHRKDKRNKEVIFSKILGQSSYKKNGISFEKQFFFFMKLKSSYPYLFGIVFIN